VILAASAAGVGTVIGAIGTAVASIIAAWNSRKANKAVNGVPKGDPSILQLVQFVHDDVKEVKTVLASHIATHHNDTKGQ